MQNHAAVCISLVRATAGWSLRDLNPASATLVDEGNGFAILLNGDAANCGFYLVTFASRVGDAIGDKARARSPRNMLAR